MYNIIVNPWSGEGKKKKLHARAIAHFQKLGQEVRVVASERPGQIKEIAHSLTREGKGEGRRRRHRRGRHPARRAQRLYQL